jgi:hypothetical protein
VHAVAGLDAHLEVAPLVVRERVVGVLERDLEVALAVGRVLEELAGLLGDVARGRQDVAAVGGLEAHELAVGHLALVYPAKASLSEPSSGRSSKTIW